jgi:hypothetical protein
MEGGPHIPDTLEDTYHSHSDEVTALMQTDIGVLKSRLEYLAHSIETVNGKLDLIVQMQVQLVRLQEQFESTRSTLHEAQRDAREVTTRVSLVEHSISDFKSAARGILVVGVVFFSFVQWYVLRQIEQVEANEERIQKNTSRLDLLERMELKAPLNKKEE